MSDPATTPPAAALPKPTASKPQLGRVLHCFNPAWPDPKTPFPGQVVRLLGDQPDGQVRVNLLVSTDDGNGCTPGTHLWPAVPVYDAGVVPPPAAGVYATWPPREEQVRPSKAA